MPLLRLMMCVCVLVGLLVQYNRQYRELRCSCSTTLLSVIMLENFIRPHYYKQKQATLLSELLNCICVKCQCTILARQKQSIEGSAEKQSYLSILLKWNQNMKCNQALV